MSDRLRPFHTPVPVCGASSENATFGRPARAREVGTTEPMIKRRMISPGNQRPFRQMGRIEDTIGIPFVGMGLPQRTTGHPAWMSSFMRCRGLKSGVRYTAIPPWRMRCFRAAGQPSWQACIFIAGRELPFEPHSSPALHSPCGFRGLRPWIPIERDHAVRSKAATCSDEGDRGVVASIWSGVRFSWLRQVWRAAR